MNGASRQSAWRRRAWRLISSSSANVEGRVDVGLDEEVEAEVHVRLAIRIGIAAQHDGRLAPVIDPHRPGKHVDERVPGAKHPGPGVHAARRCG